MPALCMTSPKRAIVQDCFRELARPHQRFASLPHGPPTGSRRKKKATVFGPDPPSTLHTFARNPQRSGPRKPPIIGEYLTRPLQDPKELPEELAGLPPLASCMIPHRFPQKIVLEWPQDFARFRKALSITFSRTAQSNCPRVPSRFGQDPPRT